jgi:fatty acid-binding protein DegV
VHAKAPQAAATLHERLSAVLTGMPARIDLFETGPAIAVHAGIGAVGVFSVF